jgi:hypothetical protein
MFQHGQEVGVVVRRTTSSRIRADLASSRSEKRGSIPASMAYRRSRPPQKEWMVSIAATSTSQ